jgi:lipopolysaccharide/colanic/teichoic acid biosynthesis glycosyltransferase
MNHGSTPSPSLRRPWATTSSRAATKAAPQAAAANHAEIAAVGIQVAVESLTESLTESSVELAPVTLSEAEAIRKFQCAMREARSIQDWRPVASPSYRAVKRAIDIFGALFALLALSPLLLWFAWRIRREDGGPAVFRQIRVGAEGRFFRCYKFRSMVSEAESLQASLAEHNHHGVDNRQTFKVKCDPRCTRIGEFIRRKSIDELPQLFNVLVGDMSLIGPRPPLPSEVAWYKTHHMKRLAVKPGLSCIWQISGRGDVPFEQQVEMDIEYIARRSTMFDLQIAARTIPAVLSGRGAY